MKRTPLFEIHQRLKARIVPFSGWEMPVQYSSILEEHRTVREKVGLFDISHMGEIEILGPGALALVQTLTCNDAARLTPGQCHYSALLSPEGTFLDDIYVTCLRPDRYLLCVNASNTESDLEWISSHATDSARVEDRSDHYALLALQGPLARRILSGPPKNRFEEHPIAGIAALISATGYTGEDGFEIFCPATGAVRIWSELMERGTPHGLKACGLGARDTLRLEAAYPLYGHEIDRNTDPFSAGLGWIVKMDKGDFVGRAALQASQRPPVRALVGLKMEGRGIARQGYPIFSLEGEEVGRITSGTYSPTLDRPIALGYVPSGLARPGQKIRVDIHREKREAVIVSLPFYRREK